VDVDGARDGALEVFWARGYEGATLRELTRAMGMNRPRLYAAFGNKEALFRKALDRYLAGPQGFMAEALKEPTARAVAEAIFSGFIRMQRGRDQARGCLVVQGALACGEEAEPVRRELARLRQAAVTAFRGGSSGPCRVATCRRARTARDSRGTWPRSSTAWPCRRPAGRPRRTCGWFQRWLCKHGRLDPSPRPFWICFGRRRCTFRMDRDWPSGCLRRQGSLVIPRLRIGANSAWNGFSVIHPRSEERR